jgi:hypothetical protein
MKIKHILFFVLAAALGSCSTAYRSAQTPDDVYYSPAPAQNTYARESKQDQNSYVTTESEQDENSYYYRNEDRDIRRGIEDPVYRNSITFSMGMGYGYNPYSLFPYSPFSNPLYNPYGYNYYGYDPFTPYAYNPYGLKGMYNPYNSFVYNDMTFYSPYGYGYSPYSYGFSPYYNFYSPTGHLRVNTNTGARKYNLNGYNNTSTRTSQPLGNSQPVRTETAAPVRSTGVGNVIRRVFTPSERRSYNTPNSNTTTPERRSSNNNIRTYNNNNDTRTYNNNRSNTNETRSFDRTPSVSTPSSSSGNSSSNSSSAPVRTFRR